MNYSLLTVHEETPIDYLDINNIHKMAFKKSFESTPIEHLRLNDGFKRELSLLIKFKGINIGHVLFSEVEMKNVDSFLTLDSVAVHPNFQGEGVGSMLIQAGIKQAKKMNYKGLLVYGQENYFPRFGFKSASKFNLKDASEASEYKLMVLELEKGCLENVHESIDIGRLT